MNRPPRRFARLPKAALAVLLFPCWLLSWWAFPAVALDKSPLEPIDTSSPRTTLQGFLEFTNKASESAFGLTQAYLASPRLFLSPEEITTLHSAQHYLEAAERTLDLSALPPATADESARRLTIQLQEVLDRIELPPLDSVPDAKAMADAQFKRWTIPGTEIRIVRMETGLRAGEYLFGPETVQRTPDFYAKVKDLPPKPGSSPGWYEFASYSPSGVALALHRVVPPRWVLAVPGWAEARYLNQPVWRWLGLLGVLGAALAGLVLCFRLSRYWAGRNPAAAEWADVLRPLGLAIAAPVAAAILAKVLRISEPVYGPLTLSLWTLAYLALTWAVWAAGGALAESLISLERLRASSIDSQLVRLVVRLLTIIAAVAILVAGADRIGLPAYSVVAGLGVGGFAVALAAQQTLANLLGSLIIMFEKPFAIGDTIKLSDIEGVVEDVGFRSTRIRTLQNSLVTIPSSQIVNSTVDNMELREYRQVRAILNLTYDTPAGKIEEFAEGVRRILEAHPDTRKDNLQVFLYEFGAHSLDVLMNFFLKVPDRAAELHERQRIFLDILQLAETQGVRFAFPTQTLHVESWPAARGGVDGRSFAGSVMSG
jgi:MscS family membrane protein